MKVMVLKPTIAPDDTDAIYTAFTRRAVTAHASKRSYCYTSMISNTLENIGFIFGMHQHSILSIGIIHSRYILGFASSSRKDATNIDVAMSVHIRAGHPKCSAIIHEHNSPPQRSSKQKMIWKLNRSAAHDSHTKGNTSLIIFGYHAMF